VSEEETQDNGINPIAKYLIAAIAIVVVGAVVIGVMNHGIHYVTRTSATSDNGVIDLEKLREEARVKPTPFVPYLRTPVRLIAPQPTPQVTPTPQRSPDPFEIWRREEAMKAREEGPIVAAFEPKPNQTKEIPSLTGQSKLQPPASPWTIDEGTVINAVLLFGVNSDYPGDLTAQIERPLYDSATGRYLLVPAGSKLIGRFQRPSGPFQERIEIGWQRLILPNNWWMDLPQMASTDTAGYAGVGGDVNHHYLSTFGTAALVSLLSVSGSIASAFTFNNAVSPYGGGIYAYSPTQQIGNLAGTNAASELGATGNRFLQPRLNRAPTVTISPDTRFNVFVDSDLILPGPYTDTAGQLINTATQR
jgi:Bacterial conjugation TrbI-like protein